MNFITLDKFQLKLAKEEDSHLIIDMLKGIAQWMKNNEINQWQYLLTGGDDEEIKQAILDKKTYILLDGNKLIATFTLSSVQSEWDEHIFGKEVDSDSLYLHRFAVIPTHMRQGIGESILVWIQQNVRDKKYVKLDCVAKNKKLNNFYKNYGFEYLGETDGHSKFQKKLR
ncbi:GNAT family N-acetyltransferase [Bacillus manliponensis]|uniref:GNAT family N-acetyltransferase n=1 Tax=Bacillus manliponensis TaxID=574376 RepID=UPI00351510EF